MKRRNNKKGFTLAELLIVVAIIAVLVAIAIPVFTNQLNAAKGATDKANARSAYAEAVSTYLLEQETGAKSYTKVISGTTYTVSTTAADKGAKWTVTSSADVHASDYNSGYSFSTEEMTVTPTT